MSHAALSPITFVAVLGIVFGLIILGRGMAGQRRAARLGDTSSSTISAMAVGEVRVSGVVEPAELALTSPLQSVACVYYRAKVTEERDRSERTILEEERAVGFRVRDASGDIRVFPGGPSFSCPTCTRSRAGSWATSRSGSGHGPGAPSGRRTRSARPWSRSSSPSIPRAIPFGSDGARRRPPRRPLPRGRPAALPRGADRAGPDRDDRRHGAAVRPAARSHRRRRGHRAAEASTPPAGSPTRRSRPTSPRHGRPALLETDPTEAWGNAAIPGFGIGRPVSAAGARPGGGRADPGHARGSVEDRADLHDRPVDAHPGLDARGAAS